MIYLPKMSDIEHWENTPELLQAKMIELVDSGQLISAVRAYQREHGLSFIDAKKAVVTLHYARRRRVPCRYCGGPLRSPNAQQCVECGADWHGKAPNPEPTQS